MLVVIRGAGDIASGIALRLHRAGMQVVMCDLAVPTSIRRTVCFSEAIRLGETRVEGVRGVLCADGASARAVTEAGDVAVLVDPEAACARELAPDALVDAILAKRNLGTTRDLAPIVIGVGPGFTAREDCDAAVETMRGHYLGRVYYEGSPIPNTAVPGLIGGYAGERVMRAPADGVFEPCVEIGAQVAEGSQIAVISDLSHFKVEGEIADTYGDRIAAGGKAIVKIGSEKLEGTVSSVTPLSKNGVISFTVQLNEDNNRRLRSGLKTDVYVMNAVKEDVMRIANASYYVGRGEYELFVRNSDKEIVKRKVQLGDSNFEFVEVIGGLQPGDEVVVSDMSQYKNKNKLKLK